MTNNSKIINWNIEAIGDGIVGDTFSRIVIFKALLKCAIHEWIFISKIVAFL